MANEFKLKAKRYEEMLAAPQAEAGVATAPVAMAGSAYGTETTPRTAAAIDELLAKDLQISMDEQATVEAIEQSRKGGVTGGDKKGKKKGKAASKSPKAGSSGGQDGGH